MYLFALFNRVVLAAGFIPSGMVKILGERFTALPDYHPMGQYLEALSHTSWYYPFIGIMQVSAAILLLIPRTATLGAVIYFPIILNICFLSLAVRFDGSLITSPLMVLAVLYLICWDYHKFKFILPFKSVSPPPTLPKWKEMSWKFPFRFAGGAIAGMVLVVLLVTQAFGIYPRNSLPECINDCPDNRNPEACEAFCTCIHTAQLPFEECLEAFRQAK